MGSGKSLGIGLGGGLFGQNIYEGQKADREQKRALRRQEKAQRDAEARAISQQRRSEQEFAKANRKQPDIGSILEGEQQAALSGASSTMLTGPGGVDPNQLRLGRRSLLGG